MRMMFFVSIPDYSGPFRSLLLPGLAPAQWHGGGLCNCSRSGYSGCQVSFIHSKQHLLSGHGSILSRSIWLANNVLVKKRSGHNQSCSPLSLSGLVDVPVVKSLLSSRRQTVQYSCLAMHLACAQSLSCSGRSAARTIQLAYIGHGSGIAAEADHDWKTNIRAQPNVQ